MCSGLIVGGEILGIESVTSIINGLCDVYVCVVV